MKSQARANRRATNEVKANAPKAKKSNRVKSDYKRKSKHKNLEF